METIENLRNNIDQVDEKIAKLLNQRFQFVLEIGHAKKELMLSIHQPGREKDVLTRVRDISSLGPLGPEKMEEIFRTIMKVSCGIQETNK